MYSAMTGQSLFYMGEMDLKHKVLAIAEEEGAHAGQLCLEAAAERGRAHDRLDRKDPATGKLVTQEYRVEGPVMIVLTTTAAEIDEELLNRCLVLTVDEGREQTQAIHAAQRERRTLAGLLAKMRARAILQAAPERAAPDRAARRRQPVCPAADVPGRPHPHAARSREVPDADRCDRAPAPAPASDATAPSTGTRLIRYVEVTLEDIALANRLAHEVLGRTLDELPPQTRRLLWLLVGWSSRPCRAQIPCASYRFSRRQVREHTRWGDTQLKIHLARLVELEYLLVHRGGRGQSFEYELLYDGAARAMRAHVEWPDRRGGAAACVRCGAVGVRRYAVGLRSARGRRAVGAWSGRRDRLLTRSNPALHSRAHERR